MTYIPKNRIITDLYTNTNELIYKDTKEFYTGYYWKDFKGKYYAGKNPNVRPVIELIKAESTEEDNNQLPTSQISITSTSSPDIETYSKLKNVNLNDIPKQLIPQHIYPKPTEDDYKLGVFDRYFLYKQNELIFLEVDEDTYKGIRDKDSKYYFTPYTQFQLPWTLTGKENEVYEANKKIVELTEKRINRRGLKQFLKGNYLKFWRPE